MSELERLRAENKALREVLAQYVKEDETYEGGKWEEINAPWLKIKRDAQALLEPKPAAETPDNLTMFGACTTIEDVIIQVRELGWQPHTWILYKTDLSGLSDEMRRLTRAFLQLHEFNLEVRNTVSEIFVNNGFVRPGPIFLGQVYVMVDAPVKEGRSDGQ